MPIRKPQRLATSHACLSALAGLTFLCSVGCHTTANTGLAPRMVSFAPETVSSQAPKSKIATTKKADSRQVAFQSDIDDSSEGLISLSIDENLDSFVETSEFIATPATSAVELASESHSPITLAELEQILLSTNPEILKAQSQLAALSGKQLQATLPPNPTAGMIGDDINADDGAGRYGVFYSQQVVRGGKLALAQSVVCAEQEVAQNQVNATRQRLLIDLRQRYYNVLLAQETVRQTKELADVLLRSVETSEKLFAAQEIAKAPVLRSQVEYQNAKMMVSQAENQRTASLRRIAALLGESAVRFESLAGDVRNAPPMSDFEVVFDQMLTSHPELSAAFASIEQARRELAKQRAVPIPNLTWQTNLQYDFTTDEVVGGFQIGMPIPKFNRNQGAISQARQNIQTSVHAADQKVIELRDRLTQAWSSYVDANIQLETLDRELLPKSAEAMELANEGYRQGETPYLELLLAQQLYAKTKLGYLQKLQQRWQYEVEIRGLISNFQ
ncbi:TolC family protein [Mariniblastus fucicola]|uniref:Cobalt-zinc-cadmium resistance protein CzcC n=1 Tax=Mariniblastus fucicola TaxID=980251 RepID=A0A5B9PD12_9BACT|nr:TolC family protein [Mariniblastus fucicola]QEG20903.1 Cobalt-zinc-cadmium resistance protein CzcC precursor [Mariniblastus fucicola]